MDELVFVGAVGDDIPVDLDAGVYHRAAVDVACQKEAVAFIAGRDLPAPPFG